jgi:phosphoribosylglycinamide formyltransferase-1
MSGPIRIAALISGAGSNLEAILAACESGRINGSVVSAGADTPAAKGLEKAQKRKIPTFLVEYGKIIRGFRENPDPARLPADYDGASTLRRQALLPTGSDPEKARLYFASRAIAEAELLSRMPPHSFDLLVLAGFMRNLSPYFIDRVNTDPRCPRIMNIHPALLPAFPGTDGYGDTFRYGCKVGGCTVHFIDYGEDTGPIIGQRAFAIEETDTIESVREKGLSLEWELYPECIALFAENRLLPVTMTYTGKNGEVRQRTIVKIAEQRR